MSGIRQKYIDTLDYLYRQLPMYQRVGQVAFKKDLKNIRLLLQAFGNPESKFPSIHIAGTNGKGSTPHMLAACYQAGGYHVGLYTSPHYRDFRERIKINGKKISRKQVVAFVNDNKSLFSKIKPSFFEITVAMAFTEFARKNVDLAIVETGLGGRLDSTNVLTPVLSIITNIGLDHVAMLGDTLEKIAKEKAGIISEGIPVIIGKYQKETAPVFKTIAKEKKSKVYFADRNLRLKTVAYTIDKQEFSVRHANNKLWYKNLNLGLGGRFQRENLRTALAAIKNMNARFSIFKLLDSSIQKGCKHVSTLTQMQGRWQTIGINPRVLCDSGHNLEGLERTLHEIKELNFHHYHFVIGFTREKELDEILKIFPNDATYYFCRPSIPRGMSLERLLDSALKSGLTGKVYHSTKAALKAAKKAAAKKDLIFVGGSTFVVAEVV
jgi:dihydrofolate synthase/folylpolyglutamate synthase